MRKIFTSPRGLPLMLSAVFAGASAPCDGYAQREEPVQEEQAQGDDCAVDVEPGPEGNIAHLSTIVGTHSSIIINVMPCLSAKVDEIAEDFSVRTGISLSEFASLESDHRRRLAGEERSSAEPVVWRGDYKNYSLWSAASIGLAPFSDPDLLRRMGTAYAFPLADVLAGDQLDRERLTDQVLDGSVGVAEHDGGSYRFILPGSESWKPVVERMRAPSNPDGLVENRSFVIARPVQGQDMFHGVPSIARVVAWDTDRPLNTVLLDAYRDELLESVRAAGYEDHEIEALQVFLRYDGAPREQC